MTITNNGRVASLRDSVLGALAYNGMARLTPIVPVSTWVQVARRDRASLDEIRLEDSARGRAVQFIFSGAAFAINCDTNVLYVTENGFGAIGIPMTSDHFRLRGRPRQCIREPWRWQLNSLLWLADERFPYRTLASICQRANDRRTGCRSTRAQRVESNGYLRSQDV